MKINELKKYRRILILGYGVEGKASYDYLKKNVPDATIDVADASQDSDYLSKQHDYDLVIKTPGIQPELVTQKYTTATNIFFANVRGVTIGVTGTKGKSTTSALIYEILKTAGLKAHLVGNIGNSLLHELSLSNEIDDYFVCELSSYQLSDCECSPYISVILNLFPDHMNYHGTAENYFQAKTNIVTHATADDYFVYNPAYYELVTLSNNIQGKPIPLVPTIDFDISKSRLIGEHNRDNVRAAVTVSQILKIDSSVVENAVNLYKTLPHRLQNVGTYKDITFYDDGSSVTPQSTIASIKTLPNTDTIMLGGQNRGYEFDDLTQAITSSSIRNIVLFPDTGAIIKKKLHELKPDFYSFLETKSLREAVKFAYNKTKQGSIVLLSNASPSYTLWKNFVEKGLEYQRLIKELNINENTSSAS